MKQSDTLPQCTAIGIDYKIYLRLILELACAYEGLKLNNKFYQSNKRIPLETVFEKTCDKHIARLTILHGRVISFSQEAHTYSIFRMNEVGIFSNNLSRAIRDNQTEMKKQNLFDIRLVMADGGKMAKFLANLHHVGRMSAMELMATEKIYSCTNGYRSLDGYTPMHQRGTDYTVSAVGGDEIGLVRPTREERTVYNNKKPKLS